MFIFSSSHSAHGFKDYDPNEGFTVAVKEKKSDIEPQTFLA